MPFGVKNVSELRLSLVTEIVEKGRSVSSVCRDFGVSRPTAYKWVNRSKEFGASPDDRSRPPLHSPNRISLEMENLNSKYAK